MNLWTSVGEEGREAEGWNLWKERSIAGEIQIWEMQTEKYKSVYAYQNVSDLYVYNKTKQTRTVP